MPRERDSERAMRLAADARVKRSTGWDDARVSDADVRQLGLEAAAAGDLEVWAIAWVAQHGRPGPAALGAWTAREVEAHLAVSADGWTPSLEVARAWCVQRILTARARRGAP